MNLNSNKISNSTKLTPDEAIIFLLNRHEKYVTFKIDICENFIGLSSDQLEKLNSHFIEKSAVILFVSRDKLTIKLFWKSDNIQSFLTLKPFKILYGGDEKEVWEFITDFLVKSLDVGHLGVHENFNSEKLITEVDFSDLVDSRGYNLLLIASESGYDKLVPFLLDSGLSWQLSGNHQITAQFLAQQGRHSNVLLQLLKANLQFPSNLNINDCCEELKNFIEMSKNFHDYIMTNDKEKLEEIISKNPNLRHFYNSSNQSALYTALDKNLIDMYEFLVSKNLSFGPDEKVDDVFRFLKSKDKDRVHKINLKYTKPFPSNHINIIMINTTLTHDETDGEGKRQIVLRAYQILNEDPFLEIILKAVAASKDFHIVFDFFKDSTYRFDPWTSEGTKGIFYFDGQITIGAKQLLDSETENQVLGTLAHELGHFAVFAAFQNNAKPFKSGDQQAEEDFSKIIEICEAKKNEEKYIRLVYDSYDKSQYPAELIVRPAHLIALYRLEPETLRQKRDIFIELFIYFENIIIPAIRAAIPDIEARLVYKPTHTFGKLSDQNQKIVKSAIALYQNEKVKLCELFPENDVIFDKLTPDHITQLLNGQVLDLCDQHLRYLEELINFRWENLAGKLKKKVLGSNAIFEGKSVKLNELNSVYPESFKSLTSRDIKDILMGNDIIVGEKLKNDAKFYAEREFINEGAKLIRFEYEYGHEYIRTYFGEEEHIENRTACQTFQDFCVEFFQQNFDVQVHIFEKVRSNLRFKQLIFNLNSDYFKFMQKNSLQFIDQAEKERILILSSEAGAGKTATFQDLAIEIKNKNPIKSVSYIDLKNHTKFFKKSGTVGSVQKLFENVLNLKSKSEFERKIFEEAFKSGNKILLWNGFDEISPTYNEFVLNLIKNIYENTKNVQYLCTRPLYSEQLSKSFRIRTWQLVPFDENAKRDFLRKFFVSQNVAKDEIEENIEKVLEVIEEFQFKKFDTYYNFNTPLMLKIIAEIHENEDLSESRNLYDIFDKFVNNKIQIWLNRSENSPEKVKNIRYFGILEKIYQKFALYTNLNLFPFTLQMKLRKLQIMQTEIPHDIPLEEISRMGILYINGRNNFEFAHRTFSDFFVAQYFIENIYHADNNVDNAEAELRLELFFSLMKSYGDNQKIITDFMSSYIDLQNKSKIMKFSQKISQLLKTKFKNFFFRMLDINYPNVFEFIFKFFEKDHEVLIDLFHVNKDETLYTAIFNPNYFGIFINPEEIKSLVQNCLTEDELQKLLNGRNQKGKILFGIHFYGLLQIDKINSNYQNESKSLTATSFWGFFDIVDDYLTLDEQKELFVTAASPKIYLYYDKMFSSSDFAEYEKLWTKFENLFSKNELKEVLGYLFIQYYEIFPFEKAGQDDFFSLLLKKSEKFLSSSQIYEMFLNNSILHEAHWDSDNFMNLWNFIKSHTTFDERKKILLQDKICDKHFYFFSHLEDSKIRFSSYRYQFFNYDLNHFKVFHRSMTRGFASTFKFAKEIYNENFNKLEFQKIILDSIESIYYALQMSIDQPFNEYVIHLEELFEGNEKSLVELLERKIEPTSLSIIEFVEDFRGLPHSRKNWFINLKTLAELYEKFKSVQHKITNDEK